MEPGLGARLGAGRMAEVFEYGEGRVVKLLRPTPFPDTLDRELAAQRAAHAAGLAVPEIFGEVLIDGRKGVVMQRVSGTDGLTAAKNRPWRIWSIGTGIGRLHHQLGDAQGSPEMLSLLETYTREIAASGYVPERAKPRLLAIAATLPESDRICHQDYHPGNVIETPEGPVIIDFASARNGHPAADFARSLILFEAGAPPEEGLWVRLLLSFGRSWMRRAYVTGYKSAGKIDQDLVRRWRPVIIGQRLTHGIPEERRQLLKMLSTALREAERG